MKSSTLSFAAGLLTGAMLFGGTAAYAAGILADHSANCVFVDGQEAQLDAYLIDGRNYVQLRDVGKAVGFNVYWDGTVQIDTSMLYTGEAPHSASAADNIATETSTDVFNSVFTLDAYHALRQIVDGAEQSDMVSMTQETYEAMQKVVAAIGEWPGYQVNRIADGKAYFSAKYSPVYQEAVAYCQPFIDGLSDLSEREKIREIAFYVCDRLTYDAGKTPSPRTVLSSDKVSRGNCMGYAHNFKFLCDMAGIPCIFVHSLNHQWNQVYVEGQWWHVDVCAMDAGDDAAVRQHSCILYYDDDMQGTSFRQNEPELTAFAKEIMVPGSV